MTVEKQHSRRRWLWAALLGGLLGAAGGVAIRVYGVFPGGSGVPGPGVGEVSLAPEHEAAAQGALRYAQAYAGGDWDYVVEHTLWMRERLDYVAAQGEGPGAVAAAREALVRAASNRDPAGNLLSARGVEDQYVFRHGARLEIVGADAGRDDLHRPAMGRGWVRVTYPSEENALLDAMGFPLRSLVAGVNLDAAGHVLKASVYGNVEINWESVAYHGADQE